VIPVEISVFEDRSFTFITKTPPASGADPESRRHSQRVPPPRPRERWAPSAAPSSKRSPRRKLPDLNCTSVDSAMRIIEGTARNMGVAVKD
jgi:large subunit ribosomal protein L11